MWAYLDLPSLQKYLFFDLWLESGCKTALVIETLLVGFNFIVS